MTIVVPTRFSVAPKYVSSESGRGSIKKALYARIRQCEELSTDYPRVRFIFSARRYFYNSNEVPKSKMFEAVSLPREGDVRIIDVAPLYFSK